MSFSTWGWEGGAVHGEQWRCGIAMPRRWTPPRHRVKSRTVPPPPPCPPHRSLPAQRAPRNSSWPTRELLRITSIFSKFGSYFVLRKHLPWNTIGITFFFLRKETTPIIVFVACKYPNNLFFNIRKCGMEFVQKIWIRQKKGRFRKRWI